MLAPKPPVVPRESDAPDAVAAEPASARVPRAATVLGSGPVPRRPAHGGSVDEAFDSENGEETIETANVDAGDERTNVDAPEYVPAAIEENAAQPAAAATPAIDDPIPVAAVDVDWDAAPARGDQDGARTSEVEVAAVNAATAAALEATLFEPVPELDSAPPLDPAPKPEPVEARDLSMESLGDSAENLAGSTSVAPSRGRGRVLTAFAALAVLAGVAFGAFWLGTRYQSSELAAETKDEPSPAGSTQAGPLAETPSHETAPAAKAEAAATADEQAAQAATDSAAEASGEPAAQAGEESVEPVDADPAAQAATAGAPTAETPTTEAPTAAASPQQSAAAAPTTPTADTTAAAAKPTAKPVTKKPVPVRVKPAAAKRPRPQATKAKKDTPACSGLDCL